ncbi:cell division ATP-binding protein FtsE [Candidatus Endobugula sertula]|uniref:Cell division ATP-binding protein FtsE n=1 Tax=Candidatus Endobugula sertula TaxID=62101 RepID=A0A1D2QPL8_9GAMM|nr:cell division ATP-binding protein FtsE [Candidatus Endobugula sertula]
MIRFDSVSKRYSEGYDALNQVSFELDAGEMAFLTGHSGAGKSTLLKLIMLIERVSRGQVFIGNRPLNRVTSSQIPYLRRQIGVVFQNHHLLFDRSVFNNVALPLQISGMRQRDQARRVRAALDKVGLLNKEHDNPLSLSGGEQQRIGIARAVVNKPSILLADEPTGNLDPELSAEIMQLFQDFNGVGTTVLIATHDIALIRRMSYRTLTLEQGRLLQERDEQ